MSLPKGNGQPKTPATVHVRGIRVCIIDDHSIVRAGVRMLLENHPGIEVVCEAATISEALASAQDDPPDVVLLDLDLGGENGLDALPKLLSAFDPARFLVLTATPDAEAHQQAIRSGASGIVLKEHTPEVLAKAIRSVHSGEFWVGRSLTATVLTKIVHSSAAKPHDDPEQEKIATLTPRERDIVSLVGQGLNGERIAHQLCISAYTVRNHLTSILDKLELSNKFELAVYASRHGLANPRADISKDKMPGKKVGA